ncbi:MAG: hypothetical protein K0R24_2408 [Gammaproteobacteria bacterium]|jgi:BolA protein|nr:hypothetical protein [Gammaproteobacteria bacterium]
MSIENRIEVIRQRLQDAFAPTHLEVQDDSPQHIGHLGSQQGAGHYTVIIAADCFKHKSRVAAHREIYQVLQDLMREDIHALKISILE